MTINTEIERFTTFAGGNAAAAKIFNCTPDMVLKLKRGDRLFKPAYVHAMYHHKGFKLNFKRLYGLE